MPAKWRRPGMPEYPWWIPLLTYDAAVGALVIGVGQRLPDHHALEVAGLAFLSFVPMLLEGTRHRLGAIGFWTLMIGASAVAVWRYPVEYDLLPVVWVVATAH